MPIGYDIIHSHDSSHPILQVEFLEDYMFFNSWRVFKEREVSHKELEESREYIDILKANSVDYNI